MIFSKC